MGARDLEHEPVWYLKKDKATLESVKFGQLPSSRYTPMYEEFNNGNVLHDSTQPIFDVPQNDSQARQTDMRIFPPDRNFAQPNDYAGLDAINLQAMQLLLSREEY